jgi:hypothetical protein
MKIKNVMGRSAFRVCFGLALAMPIAIAAGDHDTITVANLNILHGFACNPPAPANGNQCRVEDRIDLLMQHLAAVGCPDVVTLQENVTESFVPLDSQAQVGPLTNTVELIAARLPALAEPCNFPYQVVFDPEGATGPPAVLQLAKGPLEEVEITANKLNGTVKLVGHARRELTNRFQLLGLLQLLFELPLLRYIHAKEYEATRYVLVNNRINRQP